ncbi:MFS family permease [Nocardioides luteus]|nr:MFS family permease [Nocardioides luteus]
MVMGLDNVLGVVIQPWMGLVSDRRVRRRGGRLVYVVVGAPLAAIPFALMPHAPNLIALVVCIVLFAGIANAYKPVNESLLADYVTPGLRARANGFVKLGTALTVATSAVISIVLVDDHPDLAFVVPPVLMVLVLWAAAAGLRSQQRWDQVDQGRGTEVESTRSPSIRALYADLLTRAGRPWLLLVVGIIGFNGVWQALRALFTIYGVEVLDVTRGQAGGIALIGAAAFILAAVPISRLSRRYGCIGMIRRGLMTFIVGMIVGGISTSLPVAVLGFSIAAVGFACFAINAVIALWELAPEPGLTGVYTGLYAVAYTVGAASGPAVLGLVVDLTSWRLMMPGAALLACLVLLVYLRLERHPAVRGMES